MHLRRWILLGALTPGLAVIARTLMRLGLGLVMIGGAGAVAGMLARGPDPRLVRAACASLRASQAGRLVITVLPSLPGQRDEYGAARAAWQAETDAWADARVECR